jgi:hypothetical protein
MSTEARAKKRKKKNSLTHTHAAALMLLHQLAIGVHVNRGTRERSSTTRQRPK